MNTKLNSQNVFILNSSITPQSSNDNEFVVRSGLGVSPNFEDNCKEQNACDKEQEEDRIERAIMARDMLIEIIGKEEFLRLREAFRNSRKFKDD